MREFRKDGNEELVEVKPSLVCFFNETFEEIKTVVSTTPKKCYL